MVANELFDLSKLVVCKSSISFQLYWVEPEFHFIPVPPDVNVRRFV